MNIKIVENFHIWWRKTKVLFLTWSVILRNINDSFWFWLVLLHWTINSFCFWFSTLYRNRNSFRFCLGSDLPDINIFYFWFGLLYWKVWIVIAFDLVFCNEILLVVWSVNWSGYVSCWSCPVHEEYKKDILNSLMCIWCFKVKA